jgi:hypothetical protein
MAVTITSLFAKEWLKGNVTKFEKGKDLWGLRTDERTALRHAFMDVELRTERCARLEEGRYKNEKDIQVRLEICLPRPFSRQPV